MKQEEPQSRGCVAMFIGASLLLILSVLNHFQGPGWLPRGIPRIGPFGLLLALATIGILSCWYLSRARPRWHLGVAILAMVVVWLGWVDYKAGQLFDDNPETRTKAARSLEKMGILAWPAVDELIDSLMQLEAEDSAADALVNLGPAAAWPLRKAVLNEDNWERGWGTHPPGPELRTPAHRSKAPLFRALRGLSVRIDGKAKEVPELIKNLGHEDPSARVWAAYRLGLWASSCWKGMEEADEQFYQEVGRALAKALEDDDPMVRHQSLLALVRFRAIMEIGGVRVSNPAEVVPAIVRLLEKCDPYYGTRHCIYFDVATRVHPQSAPATPEVIAILSDQENRTDVRVFAARMLSNIENRASLEALVRALDDPSAEVRGNSAYFLGYHGAEASAAIPKLVELLQDKDEHARFSDLLLRRGKVIPDSHQENREISSKMIAATAARAIWKIDPNAALAAGLERAAATDAWRIPKHDLERYQQLWANSLFTLMEETPGNSEPGGGDDAGSSNEPKVGGDRTSDDRAGSEPGWFEKQFQQSVLRWTKQCALTVQRNALSVQQKTVKSAEDPQARRARLEVVTVGRAEDVFKWLHGAYRAEGSSIPIGVTMLTLQPASKEDTGIKCRVEFEYWIPLGMPSGAFADELRPIREAEHYPLETLLALTDSAPTAALRLEVVEIINRIDGEGTLQRRIKLVGSSDKPGPVEEFSRGLRSARDTVLRDYRWSTPPPKQQADGSWRFTFEAKRVVESKGMVGCPDDAVRA